MRFAADGDSAALLWLLSQRADDARAVQSLRDWEAIVTQAPRTPPIGLPALMQNNCCSLAHTAWNPFRVERGALWYPG